MPSPVRKFSRMRRSALVIASAIISAPADVEGTVLVEERHRLLVRQRVAHCGGVVVHVSGGDLVDQPLTNVALARAGALARSTEVSGSPPAIAR